jgi:hypothetical protein
MNHGWNTNGLFDRWSARQLTVFLGAAPVGAKAGAFPFFHGNAPIFCFSLAARMGRAGD